MREPFTRPSRLLIAWDGTPESSASIPCALGLAGPDAHLILLHIAPLAETRMPLAEPVVERRAQLQTHRLSVACAAMQRLATDIALFRPDVTCEIVCDQGDPAREIERASEEHDVDLVVAVLHHERAMRSAAHRSVAVQLARQATVPTMIVRCQGGPVAGQLPFRRLLCPLIASKPNTRSVLATRHLAQSLELPVRITAIIDPAAVLPASLVQGVTPRFSPVEDAFASERSRIATLLDQVATHLRTTGVAVTVSMEHGAIAESIRVATSPGDLIVLNPADLETHDDGHLLARVLREAPAPVLILPIRPVKRPESGAAHGQPARTEGSIVHV